jgi:uncharacterized membrane protein YhhN
MYISYETVFMWPFWVCLSCVSVVALIIGYALGWRWLEFLAKPLASLGFVMTALTSGTLDSNYGQWVLFALLFGMLGDLFLMGKSRGLFLAGLVSFLVGHLGYVVAFTVRELNGSWVLISMLFLLPVATLVWRWLSAHLPGEMRTPVMVYIAVICAMVATGIGTVGHAMNWMLLLGTVLFFFSDIAVARERFVAPGLVNKLWGIPFYFAGQLLLAKTVSMGLC